MKMPLLDLNALSHVEIRWLQDLHFRECCFRLLLIGCWGVIGSMDSHVGKASPPDVVDSTLHFEI